jgi:anti-anti-sigma regulatory factor
MSLPLLTEAVLAPGSRPAARPRSFGLHIDLPAGRVRVAGHLGRSTVHLLQDAVSALLLGDVDVWVIDASDVTSCDGMGMRGIGAAYRRALRHGRRLCLVGAPAPVRDQLLRLRLHHHLVVDDERSAAPTALPA